jgi:predicted kinase
VTAQTAQIRRGYVVVSGAPGAGKSTLAGPLAERLNLPLIGKDHIKETLHDHILAGAERAAWSKILGGASMELLWKLAGLAPAAVLEANFRPRSDYERGKLAALSAPLVEVYCRCPPQLAAERYAARHVVRHPTHVSGEVTLEYLAQFDRPFALGPVIEVDTRAPVDVDRLAQQVEAAFGAAF